MRVGEFGVLGSLLLENLREVRLSWVSSWLCCWEFSGLGLKTGIPVQDVGCRGSGVLSSSAPLRRLEEDTDLAIETIQTECLKP